MLVFIRFVIVTLKNYNVCTFTHKEFTAIVTVMYIYVDIVDVKVYVKMDISKLQIKFKIYIIKIISRRCYLQYKFQYKVIFRSVFKYL